MLKLFSSKEARFTCVEIANHQCIYTVTNTLPCLFACSLAHWLASQLVSSFFSQALPLSLSPSCPSVCAFLPLHHCTTKWLMRLSFVMACIQGNLVFSLEKNTMKKKKKEKKTVEEKQKDRSKEKSIQSAFRL